MKRILITGMSGLIGQLVYNNLKNNSDYELIALNRSKLQNVNCIQADINDDNVLNILDIVTLVNSILNTN